MESETSRNFPINQGRFMGNIRLADKPAKSDKSAMPTVDQVRIKIQEVLDEAQKGPVTVSRELGFPRDYLRDFLEGKKRSLKLEFMATFAEQYGVPLRDLTATRALADRPTRLYVSEHMKARGWDDAALARRMEGVTASAVAKWRTDPSRLQDWQVSALLHAFDMTNKSDLTRPPHAAKKRA